LEGLAIRKYEVEQVPGRRQDGEFAWTTVCEKRDVQAASPATLRLDPKQGFADHGVFTVQGSLQEA